jgi:molybdopterin converting factor small subunit
MKIRIDFLAQARAAAGCNGIEVEATSPLTVADAIRLALRNLSHAPALQSMVLTPTQSLHPWLMITVADQAILEPENHRLNADAVICLMPPISGG